MRALAGVVLAACALAVPGAEAQVSFAGGRLRLAGQLTANYGSDDEGYFNYGEYQTSRLRMVRIDLSFEGRLGRGASVLAEVRSDNLDAPTVYALYLRVRPWQGRALDVQAGLVPPVIGALPRRGYVADEPLPSLPLVYQYLTDLRHDAVPRNAEELVSQRGRGWLVHYPSEPYDAPGIPVVAGERWDAGLQVRVGDGPLSLAVAATQGSPSHPLVRDDNGGKQLSARLQWTPSPAWTLGVSAAGADFLSEEVDAELPPDAGHRNRQQLVGVDAAWSAGHAVIRGEIVHSRFSIPDVAETRLDRPLPVTGGFVEARYKLLPGLYAAGRLERLAFETIDSAFGQQTWDATVTRFEAGLGFTPARHVLLRGSWQHDERDGGRVRSSDLFCGSVLLWF